MKKLRRFGPASAAAIGLISLSGIASVTMAGIASAAPKPLSMRLTGLTVEETHFAVPAGEDTGAAAVCPTGDKVIGGGPFNSSADPSVTIELTSSNTNLKGWSSTEDNSSSSDESVDEWAVCAEAQRASS